MRTAAWRQESNDADRRAALPDPRTIDRDAYVKTFIDSHPGQFADSAQVARAIDAQVRAEFGDVNTFYVQIMAGCLWNERAQEAARAEESHRHSDWIADAQAGAVR